jgi:hypothetical protein
MTRIRLPRRWAQAAVLLAAAGAGTSLFGPSPAAADPYGDCTGDACQSCDDDTWWDSFCRERTEHFRSLRRKWSWKNHDRHITTMYPEMSPFCSPTHGYYQTCWRPFPYECPRCPQYVTSPAGAEAFPPGAPPMELSPATDGGQPGGTPGGQEPYFPQPAAPPASELPVPPEAALPVVPPQSLHIDNDATRPLGLLRLGPIDDVFADDEWAPGHLHAAQLTRIDSRSRPNEIGELRGGQTGSHPLGRPDSAGTQSTGLREMRRLDEVFAEDAWTPQSQRPRRLVSIGFESVN